jgi:hypothetical protein
MSRKWERMVQKNTKQTNRIRVKRGKPLLSEAASDGSVVIRGRNWTMPLFLFGVGLFCFIAFKGTNQDNTLYWLTGSSYILLGIFTYFVRRPFLKISKNFLSTRRFTGNKIAEAEHIEEIAVSNDSVLITLKGNGGKWVFSKFYHRMDIPALSNRLQEFAVRNNILIKSE